MFGRDLRPADVCFAGSNAMSIVDFSTKALACSVEAEDTEISSELCCESVSVYGITPLYSSGRESANFEKSCLLLGCVGGRVY